MEFEEAEFLIDPEVTPVVVSYDSAKPFPQTSRDAAWQEDEEEHTDSIWKKIRLQELKKGLASSTEMDFYETDKWSRLRAFYGEYLLVLWILTCLVCLIPSTFVGMPSPASWLAVLHWGTDVANTSGYLKAWLKSLTFDTSLASDLSWARQKYDCTVQL